MNARRLLPAAFLAGVLAVVAVAWTVWYLDKQTLADAAESYLLTNSAIAVTFSAFGTIVLTHRGRHRIGLLFAAIGGCYTVSVACMTALSPRVGLSSAWERAVDVVGISIWVPAVVVCLPLILQLFPDGKAISARWRWLVVATVALLVTTPTLSLAPHAIEGEPIADTSPILPEDIGRVVGVVSQVAVALAGLILLASLAALIVRTARSAGTQRLQLLWLLWAVVLFIAINSQRIVTADGPILFLLTLPLIPAAATVAIVRHQLFDIQLIINRSLVYGVLTGVVVGAYIGIVALLGAAIHRQVAGTPVLATAVIAIAFAPARARVQTWVDRAMYGRRRDPAEAVARVGARLGSGLEGVLQAVCESLRLPYAAVMSEGRLVAVHGQVPAVRHTVPLDAADDPAACLQIGLRAGETRLSAADARALDLLAPPIGVALHAVRLSDEVRQSRARIVAAREEERRRLRRDLHDGLGTALTAVTLKADAAYNLRDTDAQRSRQLLLDLRADLGAAIADIRRLVYDLRPPDLDELGLIGALRQRAQHSWRRDTTPFFVTIDVLEPMPTLPAAVEVAAYRIATEAITNALRHSRATTCHLAIRADAALHIEITDNGPTNGAWQHGVGLNSMHERTAELGGTLTAGPTTHGGHVYASLPLEKP